MNKKLKKALKWVGIPALVIGGYIGGMLGVNHIVRRTGERLETLQEAQNYLEREKKRMGCDRKIEVRFSDRKITGAAKFTKQEKYIIILGTNCRRLNVLQHELYHIHDDHVEDGKPGFFEYFFWCEPRAIWYSLWN